MVWGTPWYGGFMEIEDWIDRQRKKTNAYEIELKKIYGMNLEKSLFEQKVYELIFKLEMIYGH